jgi:hypothetical protein
MSHLALVWPGSDDRPFLQIARWSILKGQTPQRIDAAITRLSQLDSNLLRVDQRVVVEYFEARKHVLAGDGFISPGPQRETETLAMQLMPWERERSLRMLNLMASVAASRFRTLQDELLSSRGSLYDVVPTENWARALAREIIFKSWFPVDGFSPSPESLQAVAWLSTTFPWDLFRFGDAALQAVSDRAYFEASRRATIIQLAIESYKLRHNKLPKSLDAVASSSLPSLPLDPYSGEPFRYFPDGVPETDKSVHSSGVWGPWKDAGIWSTGPDMYPAPANMYPSRSNETEPVQYLWRTPIYDVGGPGMSQKPSGGQGRWFPLPGQPFEEAISR